MAKRYRREKGFWSKGRIRWLVGVGFVLWIIIASEIPATTYGSWLGKRGISTTGTYALHIPGIPPVEYSATIDYTVAGDFSVGIGNPIYMTAIVYNVNRSDFGTFFNGIDLLFQQVPFGSGGHSLLPYFRQSGVGTWTAEGNVAFAAPINFTGPVLLPITVPNSSNLTLIDSEIISQVRAYNYPFPQLQPQSYTDTLSNNEAALRYAAMGSAVLLVLLLPVFDGLILREKRQKSPDE